MRSLTLTILLLLGGCANITALYDEATGTTLAERCDSRRAGIAVYDALDRPLTENEARVRADYQIFVDAVCPMVELPKAQ